MRTPKFPPFVRGTEPWIRYLAKTRSETLLKTSPFQIYFFVIYVVPVLYGRVEGGARNRALRRPLLPWIPRKGM